jgi:hypothetical protein
MFVERYAELFMHCPVCAKVCLVETPPCGDGHGDECPDRACATCGTALFVDPLTAATSAKTTGHRAA